MPPSISGDTIRPVDPENESAVTRDPGQAASQSNTETPKTFFARQDVCGSQTGIELGEIIPRPLPISQENLDAGNPRSKLRILAVMTALFVSMIQHCALFLPPSLSW
jgi:hypothetical protein